MSPPAPDLVLDHARIARALLPLSSLILIAGLWSAVAAATAARDILQALSRPILIVAVMANFTAFGDAAQNYVQKLIAEELKATPDQVAEKYLATVTQDAEAKDGSNKSFLTKLLNPGVSLFEAFVSGVLYLVSVLASLVLFLAYLIQKLVLQAAFAMAPLFLSFLGVRALASIGVQYLLGVAGIILWPLGWAVASLLTDSLLTFAAKGDLFVNPTADALAYTFRNLLSISLVSVWVIASTVIAPWVIQRAVTTGAQIGNGFLNIGPSALRR